MYNKDLVINCSVSNFLFPSLIKYNIQGIFDAGLAFTLLAVQYDAGEWEQGDPRWRVQAQANKSKQYLNIIREETRIVDFF